MTTKTKATSIANFQPSLVSLTSIDDDFPNVQTLPSLHQTLSSNQDQPTTKNQVNPTTISGSDISEAPVTFIRIKKSLSSIPSLKYMANIEDVYDRAEKFLDDEGLFISYDSPMAPARNSLTLKPCLQIERVASLGQRSRANTEESINDNLSEDDLERMAVPSFLAKRAGCHRSMSGTFPHLAVNKELLCSPPAEAVKVQKSSFAKFHFSEVANQEANEEITF